MIKRYFSKQYSWDSLSKIIIFTIAVLQITRWLILPQFMDIYYHLLSAWGFNQAGGYSGWDFWQYAPFGRVNIYPPFFQLFLASLLKLGCGPIILAKIFETFTPLLFIFVLWRFIRFHFNPASAFFTLVACGSCTAFYFSLINHLPSTWAFIFGITALSFLFRARILPAIFFLTLCFYTHIGVSWFFGLTLVIYALYDKEYRQKSLLILMSAIILALPILIQQFSALGLISVSGVNLNERYQSQIKILDYFLAAGGIYFVFRFKGKHYLLVSFFLASLIFLTYPFRFFSAEGYFPIIILAAFFLYNLWHRSLLHKGLKRILVSVIIFMLFISPTISLSKLPQDRKVTYKLKVADAVFSNLLFAQGASIWYPNDYVEIARLIKAYSTPKDIVYCNLNILGLILGSVSGRATANALLPEIKSSQEFDPIAQAGLIILTKDLGSVYRNNLVKAYSLEKISQTRLVEIYRNSLALGQIKVHKASVPFWLIYLILGLILGGWGLTRLKGRCLKKE